MPDALLSPSAAAYCLLGLACLVSLVFVLSAIWNAAPKDDDEPYRNKDDWGM